MLESSHKCYENQMRGLCVCDHMWNKVVREWGSGLEMLTRPSNAFHRMAIWRTETCSTAIPRHMRDENLSKYSHGYVGYGSGSGTIRIQIQKRNVACDLWRTWRHLIYYEDSEQGNTVML